MTSISASSSVEDANVLHYESLILLRGPLLIALVSSSMILFLLSSLSTVALLQLGVLLLGLSLCCWDLYRVGTQQCRLYLQQWLDSVVWDEALLKFYNPDYSWSTLLTNNIMGQALWVYALPFSTTASQRVQIVQDAMQVDESTASRILLEPGGYKEAVFPPAFLQWLEGKTGNAGDDETNGDNTKNSVGRTLQLGSAADAVLKQDTPAASSSSSVEATESDESIDDSKAEEETLTSPAPTTVSKDSSSSSLSKTLRCIIQNAVLEQLRNILKIDPDSKLVTLVGCAAVASFAIQLRCSSRARKILMFLLETSSLAGLSAIVMGTVALLASSLPNQRGANAKSLLSFISKMTTGGTVARQEGNQGVGHRRSVGVGVSSLVLLALFAWRKKHANLRHR